MSLEILAEVNTAEIKISAVERPKLFSLGPLCIDDIPFSHIVILGPPGMTAGKALEFAIIQVEMEFNGESVTPNKLEYL